MRIAYIAPYQGPELIKRRPTLINLALAGNVKIELVAELLQRSGHEVEVLSQGEVVENLLRHYPAFSEPRRFDAEIPVLYASAFPARFINGLWSSRRTLALFKERHKAARFDLVLIYNLKTPQVACARYAQDHLGLPVVVEYEDDSFVDVRGRKEGSLRARRHLPGMQKVLDSASGCVGVSPHLLSRFPQGIPRLLLRGVISDEILRSTAQFVERKGNRVVFSGTFTESKGVVPLLKAWRMARLAGWELHLAGDGILSKQLHELAQGDNSVIFHGLLNRQQNAQLLSTAKIGINPHDQSATPGNVFAFKIIEYLAADSHVITTRMGPLEPELERGVTYIADNRPETIAESLRHVVNDRLFENRAADAAVNAYGPISVGASLDKLMRDVVLARSA
jgi:glycosyltransferase involved in cell wall biosynthesis